jgi:hypothetical protein
LTSGRIAVASTIRLAEGTTRAVKTAAAAMRVARARDQAAPFGQGRPPSTAMAKKGSHGTSTRVPTRPSPPVVGSTGERAVEDETHPDRGQAGPALEPRRAAADQTDEAGEGKGQPGRVVQQAALVGEQDLQEQPGSGGVIPTKSPPCRLGSADTE